jgi:glycosyltransferase involved in cell wall biosynthesis
LAVRNSQSSIPLVAVATPVYNGEKYLAETMESVQSLTYPRLIHVILDNASTDATPAIISRYSNGKVPVLVSRNEKTIPMVANFNAALRLVPKDADFFRLLCADDLLTPDAISRMVEVAQRDQDIGIVGSLERSDEIREENLPASQTVFEGKAIARAYLLRENSVLSGTHFLYRRNQLGDHQAFYDEALQAFTDADANIRVCLNSKFGFIHEGLAIWRRHENNAWNTHSELQITTVEWLELLMRYGETVLGRDDFHSCLTAQRRHCLRRLLLLRWRDGDRATFNQHLERLRRAGAPIGWSDFVDALADWALLAITGRRSLVGVARKRVSA